MLEGQKITIVLPAYDAELTLKKTYDEIPHEIVDDIVLVDDGSWDNTVEIAKSFYLRTITHPENRGYGANQKTCW